MGCLKIPRRVQFTPAFTSHEKQELRNKHWKYKNSTRDIDIVDFKIDGLENNLPMTSLGLSVLLWKYILQYAKNDRSTYEKPKFYEGIYKWFYYEENKQTFESSFLKLLKSTKWLFDKNNCLVDTKDITIEELNTAYTLDDEKVELLEKLFEFKLDDIKKFEENHPDKKIVDKNEYEDFKKFKKQLNPTSDTSQDNDWEEKTNPNDINIDEVQVDDEELFISTEDLSHQPNNEKPEEGNNGEESGIPSIKKPKVSKKTKDAIGLWGETFVNKYLLDKYSNDHIVKWLNKNGNLGKGYDFVILKDNEEILYIEVKSKVEEKPDLIEITGTQWEWARKLYEHKQGDKYQIYVVSNVNTEQPKLKIIKNPIKQWKNGKLKAHPVNFEL